MRYSLIEWPDVQYYMEKPWFGDKSYFDPIANVWFIPEKLEEDIDIYWEDPESGGDIGDLEDALG